MSHLFISYSRHDIVFVRHLKRLIEAEGLRVWLDETGLRPSEHWWRRILANIEASAGVIVVMTPHASESQWVEREVLHAERVGKRIFPVLLSGAAWPMLANIQYADLRAGLSAVLPAAFCEGLRQVVADHRVVEETVLPGGYALLEPDDPLMVLPDESGARAVLNPRPLSASNAPTILRRPSELDQLIQRLKTRERVRLPVPVYAEAPTIPERHDQPRRAHVPLLVVIAFVIGLLVAWGSAGDHNLGHVISGVVMTVTRATSPAVTVGDATSPAPTPTAIPPSLDLRLYYNEVSFVVVNVSGTTLDIHALVFERYQPDGTRHYLDASTFDRTGTLAPTTAMTAEGCFQLQTIMAPVMPPPEAWCPHLLGYFRTGVERRYFWLAEGGTAGETFVVRMKGDEAILATCDLAAGVCEVVLE